MPCQQEYDVLMSQDREEIGMELPRESKWSGRRWGGLLLLVASLVAATVVFASLIKLPSFATANPTHFVKLNTLAESTCDQYPYLPMPTVKHRNLGNQGPDNGAEGMVFEGLSMDALGENVKQVDLHLNSPNFVAHNPSGNGMGYKCKECMAINIPAGTNSSVKFMVTERGGTSPISIDKMDLTFFDLDGQAVDHSLEYIEVQGASKVEYYHGTTLSITNGKTKFQATQPGNGNDNPTSAVQLTEIQAQRSVTFIFEPFTEATLTFGTTATPDGKPGVHRQFEFVGRPSLSCATGLDPSLVTQEEVETTTETQCCLLKLGSVKIVCTAEAEKSWYHFMC